MALVLATYNVLDLFEPSDAEDRQRLLKRVDLLAARLRPHAPDVIALQEIGSEWALGELARALGGHFERPLFGDPDKRGIRNAVLSRFPITQRNVLRAPHLSFPRFAEADGEPFGQRLPLRRPIPEAVIDAGDLGHVRIFVVHFKSRRAVAIRDARGELTELPELTPPYAYAEAEVRALVCRCAEALFVRQVVDQRLAAQPDDKLVVCGDFNDIAGSVPHRIIAQRDLMSCAEAVPYRERISVLHGGEPAAIDHALLSPALAARFERCAYDNAGLQDPDALAEGEILASDHAPLIVHFA